MTRDPSRPLRDAWVVSAVRTPIGRYGGALRSVRPDDLAALAIEAVVSRSGIDPSLIEDVVLGNANGAGEENRNVARMAALWVLPGGLVGLHGGSHRRSAGVVARATGTPWPVCAICMNPTATPPVEASSGPSRRPEPDIGFEHAVQRSIPAADAQDGPSGSSGRFRSCTSRKPAGGERATRATG